LLKIQTRISAGFRLSRVDYQGKGEKPQKYQKKSQQKPLAQSCTKSVGLSTHTTKNLFFRLSKTAFSDILFPFGGFLSFGRLFVPFLAARDHNKSPGLEPTCTAPSLFIK
jgi:hypothetical protein